TGPGRYISDKRDSTVSAGTARREPRPPSADQVPGRKTSGTEPGRYIKTSGTEPGRYIPADELDTPPGMPWTRADYRHVAGLLAEVADALACAHRAGVIHRDVKPHNLLLGPNNRLHLTDFGLARLTDEPHLTISGEIMGTPAYLSPEQIRGESAKIDHRTDIYSLGITIYELLTRRKPFDGETREQIITGICTAEPAAPRRLAPRVPIDLETICLRAIEKDPTRRHPSAALLAEDLRRFAEGRPILSRRVSRLEKAAKWMRRHKALTTAMVAIAAAVLLAGGLTWSVRSARQREAEFLLREAYEQFAFVDYRTPGLEESHIGRAEALGGNQNEIQLVRALDEIGTTEWSTPLRRLADLVQNDPADPRARYLLAWVQHENGEKAAAQDTFEQAERRGLPTTPEVWFFRGLALHFDHPREAIASYRQATTLRSHEHGFYPQAVLHLARARNQQLYAIRSLEPFSEAEATLRQLIEHEAYGVYPYYLLSITHRLAAEIYQGSEGTRDDSLVEHHYAQALEWARRGQEVDPADDRPITAEAECLESMGLFQEAIEARTRAIEAANTEQNRWEGHHYRWRLHFWTGDLEAALEDVQACAGFDPQSRFYAHVYPALIEAEGGHMPAALAHARALADEMPDGAQAVLWSATCLRLLDQPEEARELLAERAETVDFSLELVPPQTAEWVRMLYASCNQGKPLETLEAFAETAASPWKLWGEAHFHAAALRLTEGNREAAREGFRRAYRSFDGELHYTYHAKLIYHKMQQDSSWPSWIAVLW
ncbi:MAG: protein kinase, partial [Phycisphaerae bacterium]|nr:protein kinase [Phycisphaerae bacterium]